MDFQQLLAKMNELDQPAPTTDAVVEEPMVADECGDMPSSPMGMSMPKEPDAPPPSMSINLNAQGLDNIEELMNLIKAVNKDMGQPAPSMAPSIEIEPMDKPMGLPPLKMLPDMDADNDDRPGGEPDIEIKGLDRDNDGDHDMDDHDMERDEEDEAYDQEKMKDGDMHRGGTGAGDISKDGEEKEETFGNSVGDSEPGYQNTDYMVNKLSGGINSPKTMHKHSYRQGDNPMAMEGEELRAWVRSELQKKLAEAKGVK